MMPKNTPGGPAHATALAAIGDDPHSGWIDVGDGRRNVRGADDLEVMGHLLQIAVDHAQDTGVPILLRATRPGQPDTGLRVATDGEVSEDPRALLHRSARGVAAQAPPPAPKKPARKPKKTRPKKTTGLLAVDHAQIDNDSQPDPDPQRAGVRRHLIVGGLVAAAVATSAVVWQIAGNDADHHGTSRTEAVGTKETPAAQLTPTATRTIPPAVVKAQATSRPGGPVTVVVAAVWPDSASRATQQLDVQLVGKAGPARRKAAVLRPPRRDHSSTIRLVFRVPAGQYRWTVTGGQLKPLSGRIVVKPRPGRVEVNLPTTPPPSTEPTHTATTNPTTPQPHGGTTGSGGPGPGPHDDQGGPPPVPIG